MRTLTTPDPRPLFACLPSDQVLDHVARVLEPESLLSGPELARAEALGRPDLRRDFVAARLLTRLLIKRWHGTGANLVSIADIAEIALRQACSTCGGPHGRPLDVAGLSVSWAHADGIVAAAVGGGPIGVDVEPHVPARVGALGVELREATSIRAWVRGEAIVKWGHGSLDDALTWHPFLQGRLAPRGQGYKVDDEGRPHRSRRPLRRVPGLVITDAPIANDRAVCSVAAHQAARWVNPLL